MGGCPIRGLCFFGGGPLILCPFSHTEMQYFKNSEIFACDALIFNIYIFRFKIHAELQVDIDFNTESKFSCSRSSFFSPLSGHSKQTKPMKLHSFLSICAFRGPSKPSNHSVSKARTFCVINKNKHGSY